MTDTPSSQTPRSRKWLMPALFVSLAVNLLVLGVVIGSIMSPDRPSKRPDEGQRALRGVIGEPYIRALPQEVRREMARSVLADRKKFRANRENLQQRVGEFLTALRAEEFDRDIIAGLLGGQRESVLRRQKLGEELLLEQLEAMTPEERSAYADALELQLSGLKRR